MLSTFDCYRVRMWKRDGVSYYERGKRLGYHQAFTTKPQPQKIVQDAIVEVEKIKVSWIRRLFDWISGETC